MKEMINERTEKDLRGFLVRHLSRIYSRTYPAGVIVE